MSQSITYRTFFTPICVNRNNIGNKLHQRILTKDTSKIQQLINFAFILLDTGTVKCSALNRVNRKANYCESTHSALPLRF